MNLSPIEIRDNLYLLCYLGQMLKITRPINLTNTGKDDDFYFFKNISKRIFYPDVHSHHRFSAKAMNQNLVVHVSSKILSSDLYSKFKFIRL